MSESIIDSLKGSATLESVDRLDDENDHHNPQILHDNKPNGERFLQTENSSVQPLRESVTENLQDRTITDAKNADEESERLVWELLQQEAEEAYRMQMEFLRSNAGDIGEEDFEVMQALVSEGGLEQELPEELDESAEEWDYDRLLELGTILGGMLFVYIIIDYTVLFIIHTNLFDDDKTV